MFTKDLKPPKKKIVLFQVIIWLTNDFKQVKKHHTPTKPIRCLIIGLEVLNKGLD